MLEKTTRDTALTSPPLDQNILGQKVSPIVTWTWVDLNQPPSVLFRDRHAFRQFIQQSIHRRCRSHENIQGLYVLIIMIVNQHALPMLFIFSKYLKCKSVTLIDIYGDS